MLILVHVQIWEAMCDIDSLRSRHLRLPRPRGFQSARKTIFAVDMILQYPVESLGAVN